MFHEVSYTAIDNSLLMLLAGMAVGLTAGTRGQRPEATRQASNREFELSRSNST
jgi:hypothetical protein